MTRHEQLKQIIKDCRQEIETYNQAIQSMCRTIHFAEKELLKPDYEVGDDTGKADSPICP